MEDLFTKCINYTIVDDFKSKGLYPYFHTLESRQAPEVIMEGKRRIMLGSNNYLGLTTNPTIMRAGLEAIDKYGTGCSGSRYLNGTLDTHVVLEKELAEHMGKEDCIIFSTGYGSNLSVLSCMAGRNDYYIIDRESHASIYDGCKLSFAKMERYKHNDMADLERLLQKVPEDAGAMIVTDGLFSMGGDYANIPEIVRLAKKYGAKVMVDDAHSFGVAGDGRGAAYKFGLQDEVDIMVGTFSKSLASLGGFVVANERVINYIRHNSKPFIFTASPTPAATASALAALRYIKKHPELTVRVNKLADYFRARLRKLGVKPKDGDSPIVPIPSKDTETTMMVNKMLYEDGVFVNCVFPPAVAENDCLIRTSVLATFTEDLLDEAARKIAKVYKTLGLI